jgi:hypothetical protein
LSSVGIQILGASPIFQWKPEVCLKHVALVRLSSPAELIASLHSRQRFASALVAITMFTLMLTPAHASSKQKTAGTPLLTQPDMSKNPLYPGIPYDVKIKLTCDPNCSSYALSPSTLSDGTVPDPTALSSGELKFTSTNALSGTLTLTLTAKNGNGIVSATQLIIPVNKDAFSAAPHGTPATGATKTTAIELPSIVLGTSFAAIVSLGVQCTTWNAPSSVPGGPALPVGFVSSTPPGASVKIDASVAALTAGTYPFTESCADAGGTTVGYFNVGVLAVPPVVDATTSVTSKYDDLCQYRFNDCDWHYTLTGGAEQSDVSSEDSQTNGAVSLFLRGPSNLRAGSLWLSARFQGAPNANNTNNLVSAFQSASGQSSTSQLPQVGTSLDYVIGIEHDYFQPKATPGSGLEGFSNPQSGQLTIGLIAALGATTPLSAQSATVAFQMPAYGTDECNQVKARYSSGRYNLPAQTSGPYVTTTTTVGSAAPTTATSGPYCIVNPVPITTSSTSGGTITTVTVSGTAIQDLGFAPGDRSSFLLKYMAGLRFINRRNPSSTASCSDSNPCLRDVVDLTVGQDQAITGGLLRRFVLKADAVIPLWSTGAYFFGSTATRIAPNFNYAPLILQSAAIVTSGASPPASTSVPSSSTWVLPLVQPNRDFYRIGFGIDLASALQKIFQTKSGS